MIKNTASQQDNLAGKAIFGKEITIYRLKPVLESADSAEEEMCVQTRVYLATCIARITQSSLVCWRCESCGR